MTPTRSRLCRQQQRGWANTTASCAKSQTFAVHPPRTTTTTTPPTPTPTTAPPAKTPAALKAVRSVPIARHEVATQKSSPNNNNNNNNNNNKWKGALKQPYYCGFFEGKCLCFFFVFKVPSTTYAYIFRYVQRLAGRSCFFFLKCRSRVMGRKERGCSQ